MISNSAFHTDGNSPWFVATKAGESHPDSETALRFVSSLDGLNLEAVELDLIGPLFASGELLGGQALHRLGESRGHCLVGSYRAGTRIGTA